MRKSTERDRLKACTIFTELGIKDDIDEIYPHSIKVNSLCLYLARAFKAYDIEVVVGPAFGGIALAHWVAGHLDYRTRTGSVRPIFVEPEEMFAEIEYTHEDEQDVTKAREMFQEYVMEDDNVTIINFQGLHDVLLIENMQTGDKSFRAKKSLGTRMVLRPSFAKIVAGGKKCLLVDDEIRSGKTMIQARAAIVAAGGEVIGAAVFRNCSGGRVTAETLDVPVLYSLIESN